MYCIELSCKYQKYAFNSQTCRPVSKNAIHLLTDIGKNKLGKPPKNKQKNKVNRILANFPLCNSDAMDLSVRKIEAVEMASPNTTRTSEPRNEITKKKTLSFSVDRLLKSSNSSEDSKLEGMKQFCNKLLPNGKNFICD